jgi:putative transposase
MPNYRRAWTPGGTFFFTHALLDRTSGLLVARAEALRAAVTRVRARHPFDIHAFVVLPDHLHAVLRLPEGDADFATRWRLIKAGFSRCIPTGEHRRESSIARGERGIWQRRYWEHLICDEAEQSVYIDYCHINPLKHGLVERVRDWPHSTFHREVRAGHLPIDWGGEVAHDRRTADVEAGEPSPPRARDDARHA